MGEPSPLWLLQWYTLVFQACELGSQSEPRTAPPAGRRLESDTVVCWVAVVSLQPLCPKELWHFVHQCYGTELGLTSDDEDYVPPDDDFNTMG